jgi:hypothetical protein
MLSETLKRAAHPIAHFDGLVLDVADPERAAAFWQVALGGRESVDGDGGLRILSGPGRPQREILRLREVDAPPRDDAHVHIDLRLPGARPDHLLAAGARVVRPPGDDRWYVLADPEDNEFCAFPATDNRPPGMFELVVKCSDAHGLARWWAAVLGGRMIEKGEAAAVVGAPDFPWDYLMFDPVPGIERFPSRLRWHLVIRDPEPSALLTGGAVLRADPEAKRPWWLLADPAGNQFCVTRSRI